MTDLNLPVVGGDANTWGAKLNQALLDTVAVADAAVAGLADKADAGDLSGKADANHTHVVDDVTDLQDAFDLWLSMNPLNLGDATGTLPAARLPAGLVMYSSSHTTRPTDRTDVRVLFLTASDPSSVMLSGDVWVRPAA